LRLSGAYGSPESYGGLETFHVGNIFDSRGKRIVLVDPAETRGDLAILALGSKGAVIARLEAGQLMA
jgi:hypothetical protein